MFEVCEKVICINTDKIVSENGYNVSSPWDGLKLNHVYTVSKVYPTSITLVELTDTFAHSNFRFKTLIEIRKDKIEKIKERLCSNKVI